MMQTADSPENKKPLLLPRLISIVAGLLVGGVFYLVSWFILIKGLHFPVGDFFCPKYLDCWTWLLLMFYIGEWVVYFLVSSFIGKEKIWTLRCFIGDHIKQYLIKAESSKLVKLRSKAEATKNSSAVLLSFSAVMISVYILAYLQHEPTLDSYQKVFLWLTGLALICALVLLFISLEALDTAVNPLFDDLMLKNSLKSLYDRGTRYYLMGLAFFMFSLLCGLAMVNVFICFIGTIFFFVFFLFHNYWCIDDPNSV